MKKSRKKKAKTSGERLSKKEIHDSEDEEELLNLCIAENAKILGRKEVELEAEVDKVIDVFNARNEFMQDQ